MNIPSNFVAQIIASDLGSKCMRERERELIYGLLAHPNFGLFTFLFGQVGNPGSKQQSGSVVHATIRIRSVDHVFSFKEGMEMVGKCAKHV